MFKDTVWWFFGAGFVMLLDTARKKSNKALFKTLLLDGIKLVIVLEFIVNLYAFSFIVELIFVPVVAFLAMTMAYAQTKKEHEAAAKMLESVLSLIGVGLNYIR